MDEGLKDIIDKWIIKADNDLKSAKQGLECDEPVTDSICFHCQQSVEKYLKLFLQSRLNKTGRIHNIAVLLQQCIAVDATFENLTGIEHLTDYAVALRYPDVFYIPDLEEAKEAYNQALKVKDFVLERLK
ncbi:HEPN domain-containing protein [bacterium]|nr:MAG: HEPN domain-containing protein [bacterium]